MLADRETRFSWTKLITRAVRETIGDDAQG
jgi:hypothetical protein